MKISNNFIEWACSFSGCDGGNIKAPIWLSGIEWGTDKNSEEELLRYYNTELVKEIEKGAYTPDSQYNWQDSLTYPYGRSTIKLTASIIDPNFKTSEYSKKIEDFSGDELFKLNLYPIAFNNTSDALWHTYKLDQITGFESKYIFQTWCFLNRFPAFADKVQEHQPKAIIGTGISYLTEFTACFAGCGNKNLQINTENLATQTANTPRRFYWAKLNEVTTLFVIPFFSGAYGLNSDALLSEMGNRIRAISKID